MKLIKTPTGHKVISMIPSIAISTAGIASSVWLFKPVVATVAVVGILSVFVVRTVRGPRISHKQYADYLEKARSRRREVVSGPLPTTVTVGMAIRMGSLSTALKKRLSGYPEDWVVYLTPSADGVTVSVAPPVKDA